MERKYDVFISFKNSDSKGNKTKDSIIAEKLYGYLTEKGLSVFFSNVELEFIGKAQYTRVIDDALESSQFLIAVGCSHENLNSQWVRYEWESFINDVRSGIKTNAEVFVVYQDMTINQLPRALRQNQAFNAGEATSYEKLCNFIINSANPSYRTAALGKPGLTDVKKDTAAEPISAKSYSTISLKDINPQLAEQYVEAIFNNEGGYLIFKEKRVVCVKSKNPPKKLKTFIKPFKSEVADEIPLIFLDDTMFSNGKSGFLLTDKAFYIRELFEKPARLDINNITGFRHIYKGDSGDAKSKRLMVSTVYGEWSNSLVSAFSNDTREYNGIVKILSAILFGEEYPSALSAYEKNGWLYASMNENEKALEYYNKALNENKNAKKADYDKSLELYNKILELQIKIYGEEHADIANTYNRIGLVYGDMKSQPAKELEYYKKALEMRLKLFGEENTATATSYNNVGTAYRDLGDFPAALENHNKALEIRIKIYGEEHNDVASVYNYIGLVYKEQNNHEKTFEYYNKALEIRLRILGEENIDTAVSILNVGSGYYYLGDYSKALEMHLKALELRKKYYGEESAKVALSYEWLGDIYNKLNDKEKAFECYSKALEIRQKVLPPNHPDLIKNRNKVKDRYKK